jgi:hypothetical protein
VAKVSGSEDIAFAATAEAVEDVRVSSNDTAGRIAIIVCRVDTVEVPTRYEINALRCQILRKVRLELLLNALKTLKSAVAHD